MVPFNPLPSLFRMSSLSTGEQHSRRAGVRECFPVNEVPLLINGGRAMPYGVLVVLLTCLLSATGAAVAGATAPSPPLVTPLPESPEEYLFAPPKWKPGASVRIEEHIWTEEKTRGVSAPTKSERHLYSLKGIDRTSKGSTRVEVTRDGVVTGFLLGDDEPNQDTDRSFESPLGTIEMPLKRGQRTRLEIPTLYDSAVWEIEYLGLVEFEGVKVHAVRATTSTETPMLFDAGERVDKMDWELLFLMDIATGLRVVEYGKLVGVGLHRGEPSTFQQVTKRTVDRTSINGF